MNIVFFCQSCGARFEVGPGMAGKKGHCRKCGQVMTIPKAEHLASMTALPALGAISAAAVAVPTAAARAPSMGGWLRSAASSVGLAPLTLDRVPIGMRRGAAPSPLDDAEDSKPYLVAGPELAPSRGRSSGRPNVLLQLWRGPLGAFQKLFRKLNQTAYLVSIPFVMILLFGIAVKSRPMALFAATFVVLLNIGRIVAGIANLAVVPLRDGLNVKKMKKPLRRVAEPVVMIGLVILAFIFIPWLSSGKTGTGNVADRLRSGTRGLGKEMIGEARNLDVKKIEAQAREKLKALGTEGPSGEATPKAPQPGAAAPAPGVGTPSPEAAVRGLMKGVGERVRETVEESQKQP
jgi:hypothetical protein